MSFLANLFKKNISPAQKYGEYQLVQQEPLGKGASGEVYLVKSSSPELLAMKVFNTANLTDEDRDTLIESFMKEARILLKFSHPNIVKLVGFGLKDGNTPYLIMKYFPHGDLRTLLKKKRTGTSGPLLSMEETVDYIQHIAAALQYAHDRGVIHRDVKPQNMLMGDNHTLCLSDFGISTNVDAEGKQTTIHENGTYAYIAPEQTQAKAERASDQYSLAIVAYEWLSGELPFQGNIEKVIWSHIHKPPPPFHKSLHIPEDMEEVIFRALEKDPVNRYPSVQEFAYELKKAYLCSQATSIKANNQHPEAEVTRPKTVVLNIPPQEETALPSKLTPRDYFSQWLSVLLFSSGCGATAGILSQSWLVAASSAFLLALLVSLLFYAKDRKRHKASTSTINHTRKGLSFFISFLIVMIISISFMTFLLSPFSSANTATFGIFNTYPLLIETQAHIGLSVGLLSTFLVSIILMLAWRNDKRFWYYLFIYSFMLGLAIWLLLLVLSTFIGWNISLNANLTESLLSLLTGTITTIGMFLVLRMWIK